MLVVCIVVENGRLDSGARLRVFKQVRDKIFDLPAARFIHLCKHLDSQNDQCCGSGSVLDPYSGAFWIRIRIPNMDPDPHMTILDKMEAKDVRFNY